MLDQHGLSYIAKRRRDGAAAAELDALNDKLKEEKALFGVFCEGTDDDDGGDDDAVDDNEDEDEEEVEKEEEEA